MGVAWKAKVLVFKFDEYSWYRNCLDEIQDEVGKIGVAGEEVPGDDGKWTILIDAIQFWILDTKSIAKIILAVEYYAGERVYDEN
jgi:hypothetical protein